MPKTTKHLKEHQFKPGVSGNPNGRPRNPMPKALRSLTLKSYQRIIKAVCKGNLDNVQEIISDQRSSALEVAVATSFVTAVKKGDYSTVERIVERIIGRIPEEINLNSRNVNLNAAVPMDKVKAALAKLKSDN